VSDEQVNRNIKNDHVIGGYKINSNPISTEQAPDLTYVLTDVKAQTAIIGYPFTNPPSMIRHSYLKRLTRKTKTG
jgi:hypothetical protein